MNDQLKIKELQSITDEMATLLNSVRHKIRIENGDSSAFDKIMNKHNKERATGEELGVDTQREEIKNLKRKLKEEQDKITCQDCEGKGYIRWACGHHYSDSDCSICNGPGRCNA